MAEDGVPLGLDALVMTASLAEALSKSLSTNSASLAKHPLCTIRV